jgi:hypothetical protein
MSRYIYISEEYYGSKGVGELGTARKLVLPRTELEDDTSLVSAAYFPV